MYTKYLQILAKWCADVFQDMANTTVVSTNIKKDERLFTDIAVAHVVEYEHLDDTLKGHVMLGFNNKTMAVLVASAISEHMGFPPVTQLDDQAKDILGEFVNTFVGRTVSEWDQLGLPVRFSPPVALDDLAVESYNPGPSEAYMIILSLTVGHIVLRVTFSKAFKLHGHVPRILLVDDSALIRKLLRKTLENEGFQIEEAKDGAEAVQIHKSFQPDLTIMDMVMPVMGGLDSIVEIRESTPDAKFIVLTSTSRKDEIITAKTLGVLKYVIKPITDVPKFINDIRESLKK
jgi:CheY-like chemotaxis protein/CheY-specific phosphatase CheX